jgi:uncharacterized membrane protein YbhN (UPF0104 family)
VTALLVEYVVLPQLAGAEAAIALLSTVTPGFLAFGIALEVASLMSYSALTRCVLTPTRRPSWWTILRVDLSALGVSHVLPGGGATAGALRLRLLTVAGMAPGDVLTATAIEGAGTAVVLVLVFGLGLLTALPQASGTPYLMAAGAVAGVLLVACGCAVVLLIRDRSRVARWARAAAGLLPRADPDAAGRLVDTLATRLLALGQDHRLMVRALSWASANWLLDAASLWVFLRAYGPSQGLHGLLVGYGLAAVLALLPLTPGGLGIVEGTLVSVLVAFGTPQAHAVLGVITWRLAEFWLPIPLSAATYLSLRTGTLRPHGLPARPVIPRP